MTEPQEKPPGHRWRAGVVLLAAAAIIIIVVMQVRRREPAPPASQPAAPASTPPAPAPPPGTPSKAEAFALVYPQPDQPVRVNGETSKARFSPAAVYPLGNDLFALVSLGKNKADGHANDGFYSVAYLRASPTLQKVGEPFVGSASNGGFGEPPEVSLNTRISAVPTLVVQSSYRTQGEQAISVDLVRLGDRPALVAQDIPVLEDNSDAFPDPKDPEVRKVEGHIKAGVKDDAFAVVYRGSFNGAVVWRWDGARWRCTGDQQCPTVKP